MVDYKEDKSRDFYRQLLDTNMIIDMGWASFQITLKDNLVDDDGDKCYGWVDFSARVMGLERNMPDALARETFSHEMWHILLETVGYGDDLFDGKIITNNEHLTEAINKVVAIFKRLNPRLYRLLFWCH